MPLLSLVLLLFWGLGCSALWLYDLLGFVLQWHSRGCKACTLLGFLRIVWFISSSSKNASSCWLVILFLSEKTTGCWCLSWISIWFLTEHVRSCVRLLLLLWCRFVSKDTAIWSWCTSKSCLWLISKQRCFRTFLWLLWLLKLAIDFVSTKHIWFRIVLFAEQILFLFSCTESRSAWSSYFGTTTTKQSSSWGRGRLIRLLSNKASGWRTSSWNPKHISTWRFSISWFSYTCLKSSSK